MAGPNPHRLYSFAELRAIAGRSWVVCLPCRRYVTLPRGLAERDTLVTTFSCSVCGEEAKHVLEDPEKAGLQHDPRPRPRHHADAVVRLKVFAEMRRRDEERNYRERAVPTERPKPEPPRRYKLKAFPVRTFGDLAVWGLKATVHCGSCRHHRALVLEDKHLALPLLRPRLACSAIRPATGASEATPCPGRGQLWLSPADLDGVPAAPFVTVVCGHQDHTYLMANYLMLDRPPWAGYLGKGENFGCPQCGRRMGHTWHQAASSRLTNPDQNPEDTCSAQLLSFPHTSEGNVRCYLMRKGHIGGIVLLTKGSDESLIEQGKAIFARQSETAFDGFEV